MRSGLLVTFVLFVANPSLTAAADTTCRGCNLVLISADTLRPDHLGCYGYPRATSPAIDRLAAESVRFARAYSSSAWTLPGHLSMLMGRYPTRESEFAFFAPAPISEAHTSVAQVLQQAGYATAGFTGGGYVGEGMGFGRGFDVYTTSSEKLAGNEPALADWLAGRESGRPFFLFFHGYDVHAPYDPPDSLRRRWAETTPEKCKGLELRCNAADYECLHSPGGREYLVAQYDAEIAGVDAAVQWLLDELDRRGLRERTIVVFTADHGENLMDDDAGRCGHAGDLGEPVFRVPLIANIPGKGAAVIFSRVSLVDLAPTLLDLLGVAPAPSMHGRSFAGLLDGSSEARPIYGVTALEHGYDVLAIIDGERKLVAQRDSHSAPWRYELYDLAQDPHAARNLVAAESPPPAGLEKLQKDLFAWTAQVGVQLDDSGPPTTPMPCEVRDRLEKLGYGR